MASPRSGRRWARRGQPPDQVPFTPSPVAADAARTWVEEQAAALVPGAVDEVLGYALDNVINAKADQWIAQVQSEFAQFASGLRYALRRAESAVDREQRLQPPDTHRAAETEAARNAAAVRLRGEHEKPGWTEPGHADPTMLAGRPRGHFLYGLALVAAVAADIVAFYQVVELVLANVPAQLVAVLVVGFTAIAIFLAHYAGTMLRDRKAGATWAQRSLIVAAACAWAVLGILAFLVRLRSSAGASSGFSASVTAPAAAGAAGQGSLAGAALFGGLYAATGIVALLGAYLSHNPLVGGFMRAVREHRAAAGRQAAAAGRLTLAAADRDFYAGQLSAGEAVREEALRARHALAAELKQQARLELAKRLRDTSATDAFLNDDARPYTYRPFPS